MKKLSVAVIIITITVLSFSAGGWYGTNKNGSGNSPSEREVLYYTDPMTPGFRSETPGIAPCGMPLEPVYADGDGSSVSLPPGAVPVNPALRQVIGVDVETVEKKPMTYRLRLYGRIIPDETKIFRINASTDSWVRVLSDMTTGNIVKKDQLLAEVLAPAFYNAQVTYLIALDNVDRIMRQLGGELRHQQADIADNQIRMAVQALQNLGITDAQIEELATNRQAQPYLQVRSPSDGVILNRNLTLYQWFRAGEEFFSVSDISRVWVYADVFEDEAKHLYPGMPVTVEHKQMGETFAAKVSNVLPLFDPLTKTLKVRLDVDNSRYDLRPDMFVDVEIPITMPASLHVTADAVINTGTRQVVYVDAGNRVFEPRVVKTGWHLGRRVEIVSGLMPGEKVVVSGNFLIDSESRMKTAAGTQIDQLSTDPVCGMTVDPIVAEKSGKLATFQDNNFYFCADRCRDLFENDPHKYTDTVARAALQTDPVCGMKVDLAEAEKAGKVTMFEDNAFFFCSDNCQHAFKEDPPKYAAKMKDTNMHEMHNMAMKEERRSWLEMLEPDIHAANIGKDGYYPGKETQGSTISLGDPNVVDWRGLDKDGKKRAPRVWRKGWGAFPGSEYLGLTLKEEKSPAEKHAMHNHEDMENPSAEMMNHEKMSPAVKTGAPNTMTKEVPGTNMMNHKKPAPADKVNAHNSMTKNIPGTDMMNHKKPAPADKVNAHNSMTKEIPGTDMMNHKKMSPPDKTNPDNPMSHNNKITTTQNTGDHPNMAAPVSDTHHH